MLAPSMSSKSSTSAARLASLPESIDGQEGGVFRRLN